MSMYLIWTLAGVAFLVLLALYRFALGRQQRVSPPAVPACYAETSDGVSLALYRHGNPKGEPVLMVHGLGANHYNFDYPFDQAPARLYAEAGYDVWTVDLRGHGNSGHSSSGWYRSGFDEMVRFDIPAVVATVLAHNGKQKLHWVGHSMGGMLFYAWAGSHKDVPVVSAVTLGSPVKMFKSSRLNRWAFRNRTLFLLLRVLPINVIMRWTNPLLPMAPAPFLDSQLVQDNCSWPLIKKVAWNSTNNESLSLLFDFLRWIVTGQWDSREGAVDYRAGLQSITTPTLVVVGSKDRLCPPRHTRNGWEEIGSDDKRFFVAGTEEGLAAEYGHIDLVFGKRAGAEVVSQTLAWAASHPLGESTDSA